MIASDSNATTTRLRYRLERRFALRDFTLHLDGTPDPLTFALPADPDAPLDEMAAEQARRRARPALANAATPTRRGGAAAAARATIADGAHLPYWALLWPSGLALAEALLAHPDALRSRRTLELGCGLGSTATVAARLGADLTISDLFPDALLFAGYNTLRNTGLCPQRLLLNWRIPAGRDALLAAAPFDTLLAADVLYEQEDIEPLLTLAPALLRPGGSFWLAEPGRKASGAFLRAAEARGWASAATIYERAWPPDDDLVRVTVHHFTALG